MLVYMHTHFEHRHGPGFKRCTPSIRDAPRGAASLGASLIDASPRVEEEEEKEERGAVSMYLCWYLMWRNLKSVYRRLVIHSPGVAKTRSTLGILQNRELKGVFFRNRESEWSIHVVPRLGRQEVKERESRGILP
jgi:hypothetical protein